MPGPRKALSGMLLLMSIFLLYTAMTARPGTPDISSVSYVGFWVGAVLAIILALWLARRSSKGDV